MIFLLHGKNTLEMKNHDCEAIAFQIQLLLDGRLSTEEETVLIAEVKQCLYCLEMYDLEEKFKNYLKNKIVRKTISSTNLDKIIQKIK